MNDASFMVERTVLIRARRGTVFRYFTDSARFAAWWGAGSSIEPHPGGKVEIRYPNGVTAGGEVSEIVEGQRIVFSYGYDAPDKPIARGASRVTITFTDEKGATRVHLQHAVSTEAARDAHVPGWRFQLSMFANVVAKEAEGEVASLADRYLAAWSEKDEAARLRALDSIVTGDIQLRDAFACLSGRDDVAAHMGASQMHMPGIELRREGEPLFCQGSALVDWTARKPDGTVAMRGTNALEIVDGRVASVTGFSRRP
jgi:uncharacterized protein YndB with AHSA1/START domain